MRIFLAGGTGVVGRQLVPILIAQGHQVVALSRTQAKAAGVEATGATVVIADALDRDKLSAAIRQAKPEVINHQLTSLVGAGDFRRLDREFALTNRLRTEATDTMLEAGRQAGTRRFIAQSFCGWPFARDGGPIKTEEDPLDTDPPDSFKETLAAIRYLEERVRTEKDLQALALRYGILYGPGTAIAEDGIVVDLVRKRKVPIVGDGGGVWSFVHVQDAAKATALAVSRGAPGIYNVVDDEPAPVSEWLPALARAVGAESPRRVPEWLGRIAVGDGGVMMMTRTRGGSNTKAKREFEWQLRYPAWRQGFAQGLAT